MESLINILKDKPTDEKIDGLTVLIESFIDMFSNFVEDVMKELADIKQKIPNLVNETHYGATKNTTEIKLLPPPPPPKTLTPPQKKITTAADVRKSVITELHEMFKKKGKVEDE